MAARPSGVFSEGSMTGKIAITGMRNRAQRSATASNWSMVWRLTPGIEVDRHRACLRPAPSASCTKQG